MKHIKLAPNCIDVSPQSDHFLLVTFDNGERRLFDVKPYFKFKHFEILKNQSIFNTVKPAGLSVEWASGHDICPDDLYYDSLPVGDEVFEDDLHYIDLAEKEYANGETVRRE